MSKKQFRASMSDLMAAYNKAAKKQGVKHIPFQSVKVFQEHCRKFVQLDGGDNYMEIMEKGARQIKLDGCEACARVPVPNIIADYGVKVVWKGQDVGRGPGLYAMPVSDIRHLCGAMCGGKR